MGERKVIQVSQTAAENGYTLVVLCDDGTMWWRDQPCGPEHMWMQVHPVPQSTPTPADAAGVIPQYVRDGWRREKGNGMTSAVGEYTPAEFWTLLDAYERLLTAARGRGGA